MSTYSETLRPFGKNSLAINRLVITDKQGRLTSSSNVILSDTNELSLITTSALTTGTIRSLAIQQTMTATSTGNIVECLYVKIVSDVKTGAWCNAIVGSINYSTSGAAHGMAAAICAEMIPPNSSLVRGGLYSLDCEIGPGASSSWGSAGPVAWINFGLWGTKTYFEANGFLFCIPDVTAATGAIYDTDASAATGDATIKIKIGATTKYLLVADDAG